MGDKLKVDYEELEYAIDEMRAGYEGFQSFSENGFQTELGYLGEMNSDFVDKLTRVLEIAKDWNIDTINENISNYITEAEAIYQQIKERDEELAES